MSVSPYCLAALDYLSQAHDEKLARFSFSSTMAADGTLENDFATASWLRYTINTYLGLCEAERNGAQIDWLGDVRTEVTRFVRLHESSVENCGDNGLLLVLLRALWPEHPAAGRALTRLDKAISSPKAAHLLNMQDLAWALWGACAWSESDPQAQALAHRYFQLIQDQWLDRASGMPRHSLKAYRRHIVSFGSIVYFLRAMHEYGTAFASDDAIALFSTCLRRVLMLQRADGAWPWLVDARTAKPIDRYPLFSVHQDSMAMLFLFPAQQLGWQGLDLVIERSVAWNFGDNELGAPLVGRRGEVAWFERSIESTERWPRARRYVRGATGSLGRKRDRIAPVRVNPECRSYHLGWVLYTWSARPWPESLQARDPFSQAAQTSERRRD